MPTATDTTRVAQAFRHQPIDKQDCLALKALAAGTADEYQQKRALNIIVKNFARMYDVAFVPGAADQSAFLAGRAYVASRILYYINYPASKLDMIKEDSPL